MRWLSQKATGFSNFEVIWLWCALDGDDGNDDGDGDDDGDDDGDGGDDDDDDDDDDASSPLIGGFQLTFNMIVQWYPIMMKLYGRM